MAKETRILAGPEDVRQIGLSCTHCNAEVMVNVEEQRPFPDACPICQTSWRHDKRVDDAKYLVQMMQGFHSQPSDKVRVQFVLNDDQATNS